MVTEDIGIDVVPGVVDDLGHTELDVRDVVLGSLQEYGDDVLRDLVLLNVGHHGCQRVQTAHSVVVALLVDVVVVVHNWDELVHYPVLLELLSELSALRDAHLTDTSGSIGQVSHENALQVLAEGLFSEDLGEISDELEDSHSNSPLSILGHVSQG